MPPQFFVPNQPPENYEAAYAEYASLIQCEVPPGDKRIHAVYFSREGEDWEAVVGEQLRGVRLPRTKKEIRLNRRSPISDPVTVLAIFGPSPYKVLTSLWPYGDTDQSKFINPFMCKGVAIYFSAKESMAT